MKIRFHLRYFAVFFFSFALFTIIGTLSHEFGHIYVAHQLGFETELHFASMNWGGKESSTLENFWISFGGPLQTMLTGTVGFWYCFENKEIEKNGIKFRHWIGLFLGLFWLRPVFNLFQGFLNKFLNINSDLFGGDEAYLSSTLGFPMGSLSILFAIIGGLICSYLLFKVVPQKLRYNFLLAGFTGSLIGFWIWMNYLGPILLP